VEENTVAGAAPGVSPQPAPQDLQEPDPRLIELEAKVRQLEAGAKLNYTRQESAKRLNLCMASIDLLITQRVIRVPPRKGRKVLVPASEIERVAAAGIPQIWPPKRDGRTTRHFAPERNKKA